MKVVLIAGGYGLVGSATARRFRAAGRRWNWRWPAAARAPEDVVEENRDRLAEAEAARAKLESALSRLTGAA